MTDRPSSIDAGSTAPDTPESTFDFIADEGLVWVDGYGWMDSEDARAELAADPPPGPVLKHGDPDRPGPYPHTSRSGPTLIPADDFPSAWAAIYDADDYADDPHASHPDRYEPNRGFGTSLKIGERETWPLQDLNNPQPPRLRDQVAVEVTGSITDLAARYEIAGTLPLTTPDGRSKINVWDPASVRPPKYLYRVVSEEDWAGIQARGHIVSDGRMNLGDEGTVTSLRPTGTFYAPRGNTYRILRLSYADVDGWILDHDGYVKTHKPVPLSRVDAVTSPLAR